MIEEQQALEYESGRLKLIGSWFYRIFPKLFVKGFTKRYMNYRAYMEFKEAMNSTTKFSNN